MTEARTNFPVLLLPIVSTVASSPLPTNLLRSAAAHATRVAQIGRPRPPMVTGIDPIAEEPSHARSPTDGLRRPAPSSP